MNKEIYVTRPSLPDYEEYCNEIKRIWDSKCLTNMGPEHNEFQKQLEEYLDIDHVILFTNGHLALESIIEVYGFERNSEIITTPYTFISTTHAIVRNGMIPVFCDIKADDYTIDTDMLESLITDKTVAIVPVHVYGHICEAEKIEAIAQKHGLKVIYDAAHAFGVKYKGVSAACYGDASMFSFHATKVFNTIEGGAVCFKDDDLIHRLNNVKNFGIRGEGNVYCIGGNAKMNEFQAAMGICNLRHIDEEIQRRKRVYEHYISRLDSMEGIKISTIPEDTEYNYSYFPVVFEEDSVSRDDVWEMLGSHGIYARKYFYPLTYMADCYKGYFGKESHTDTPVAKRVSDNVLTLPIYSDLDIAEVDRICDLLAVCLGNRK